MGTWWEKDGLRRTVSQFHEVMGWAGHQLGGRRFGIFVQIASQVSMISDEPRLHLIFKPQRSLGLTAKRLSHAACCPCVLFACT